MRWWTNFGEDGAIQHYWYVHVKCGCLFRHKMEWVEDWEEGVFIDKWSMCSRCGSFGEVSYDR